MKLLNEAAAGKIAYQTYTITHGIEKLTVLVPLKNAQVFEEEFNSTKSKSKESLLEVVSRHSGKIKG